MADIYGCSHTECKKKAIVKFVFDDTRLITSCQEHAFDASAAAWTAGAVTWKLLRTIARPLRLQCRDCRQVIYVDPKTKEVTHESKN